MPWLLLASSASAAAAMQVIRLSKKCVLPPAAFKRPIAQVIDGFGTLSCIGQPAILLNDCCIPLFEKNCTGTCVMHIASSYSVASAAAASFEPIPKVSSLY
jgi:hypothetical protein